MTDAAPRDVFCPIWHLHPGSSAADDACAGVFEHAGHRLELGIPPDWDATLPSDEEWGIEWNKFYFGLELAQAFARNTEHRYLAAWEELVSSWIKQAPARFRSTDVTARRVQNWIFAWSRFAATPGFRSLRPGLADRLRGSLSEQTWEIRNNLTRERNHRTLELFALSVVAMGCPDLDSDGALLDFSVSALEANAKEDLLSDGAQRERSTHYHMIVLRNLLAFRENARRFGVHVSASFDDRVQRACDFALHIHRPDGTIPMLSDSDSGSYLDLLGLAADLYGREDYLFVATSGRRGLPPRERRGSFSEAGYITSRGSWSPQGTDNPVDAHLLFDCGPVGDGGHGHYDALHLDLFESGVPIVLDPGRYTYEESDPNWRHWFKGTRAHNTVCVDGLDQTPYRRGKPKRGSATALLLERVSSPGLDSILGSVESPCYPARHQRRVFQIDPGYWIVIDRLVSPRRHRFELLWHLAPEGGKPVLDRDAAAVTVETDRAWLEIWPGEDVEVEEGWIARQYGIREQAPVVVASQDASHAHFVTLLAGARCRGARLASIDFEDDISFVEVCHQDGRRDQVLWREHAAAKIHIAGTRFDAPCMLGRSSRPNGVDHPIRWEVASCRSIQRGDGPCANFETPRAIHFDAGPDSLCGNRP